uniref:Uncharacterized protein n=1 Tax=Octactis speculum TaxID=3111310 RepID=A0A7S2MM39_9STRA|mmetsp:Transcript_65064/g.89439  ORF Transcript_65064/g.89439 Transcript_65064/m.89439 type:complete len:527 (+) Transcript_65064:108-1688(+)
MPLRSLKKQEVVLIKGLVSAAQHNFKAGVVVREEQEGRIVVQLLLGEEILHIKPSNCLLAHKVEDRVSILLLQIWEFQLELRVARSLLLDVFAENMGICLHIASFWPQREGLMHFSGYNRRVLPESYAVVPFKQTATTTVSTDAQTGKLSDGHDARLCASPASTSIAFRWHTLSPMPTPRIDCASVDLGYGRVLFAGGCGKHPQMCAPHEFLKNATMYDSLTDTWTPLPDMQYRRQGCTGALLGSKVYVIGGEYVNGARSAMNEVFDLQSWSWSVLGADQGADGPNNPLLLRCFAAVAAVRGRVVVVGGNVMPGPIAQVYNPMRPELGWISAKEPALDEYGACGFCLWREHLVLAGGRGDARNVEAFTFSTTAAAAASDAATASAWSANMASYCDRWSDPENLDNPTLPPLPPPPPTPTPPAPSGNWTTLPAMCKPRVGPAICVIHNTLYASGGVDERSSEFTTSVERYEPGPDVPRGAVAGPNSKWVLCENLKMPAALHAHTAHGMPMLWQSDAGAGSSSDASRS